MTVSAQRRREVVDALRRGTVPRRSLDTFAVGMDRFEKTLDDELALVKGGGSVFKAVRGDYGSGKTFFARWMQERAKQRGFAVAEVQISETETPLHRLETVYRRMVERLATSDVESGALRSIFDAWFYTLEEDVLSSGSVDPANAEELLQRTNELMEQRLSAISRSAPMFAATLRAYREAAAAGDSTVAESLLAWIGGQPNVAATVKRLANVKGDIDHFGALNFLQGLLVVLRDAGFAGLVIVLDEVETLQRVRGDVREKGLNALRQLIDEIDAGRFPGLYLMITGTPSFFDSPQGVQRLPPLTQRLHTDFATDARYDNPRAVQIRLQAFSVDSLVDVGTKVRGIFAEGLPNRDRIDTVADDSYVRQLAMAVAGKLGGKVGVAPRIFLKKLVGDVLDRIDQFPDFDPRRDYALTIADQECNEYERAATRASDVELTL
jgi:P-loop Domain of unknown function (DUF2791)